MKKIVLSLLLTVVFAVPAFSQMMDMPMMEHMEDRMMDIGMMGMWQYGHDGRHDGHVHRNMQIRWGLPMTRS